MDQWLMADSNFVGIKKVNNYSAMIGGEIPYTLDGIHLNYAGQRLHATLFAHYLRSFFRIKEQ
jgi:hypothetical protein